MILVEAKLERDTEIFGKMDPYCVINYRETELRSNTLKDAGKHPKWNQVIDPIEVLSSDDEITFTVKDSETLITDKVICAITVKLSEVCKSDEEFDVWLPLSYKDQEVGQIHLKTTWKPDFVEKQQSSRNVVSQSQPEMPFYETMPIQHTKISLGQNSVPSVKIEITKKHSRFRSSGF